MYVTDSKIEGLVPEGPICIFTILSKSLLKIYPCFKFTVELYLMKNNIKTGLLPAKISYKYANYLF